jgi:transposase
MPSEMQAELSEILLQGAILYGFETNNWTQKRVQFIIQEKFAINYHYCYVSRFLSKLSFSLQKPSTYNYKKVEEDADEWRENTLPCLKKS